MLTSLFSSNDNPLEEKKEPSSFDVGSFMSNIFVEKPKPKKISKDHSDNRPNSSKNANDLKSSSLSKDGSKSTRNGHESIKDKSYDSKKLNGTSHSHRTDRDDDRSKAQRDSSRSDKRDKQSAYDAYNPLANGTKAKTENKTHLQKLDSFDIPIKKKEVIMMSTGGDSSPKIKKKEPSSPKPRTQESGSPKIKRKEPSSPKIKKVEAPTMKKPELPTSKSKPSPSALDKRKEIPSSQSSNKPIPKPVSSQSGSKVSSSPSNTRVIPKVAPAGASSRDSSVKRPITPESRGRVPDKLMTPRLLGPSSESSKMQKPSSNGSMASKPLSAKPSSGSKPPTAKPSSSALSGSKQPAKPIPTTAKPSQTSSQSLKPKPLSSNSGPSKPNSMSQKPQQNGKMPVKPVTGTSQVKKVEPGKPGSQPNKIPPIGKPTSLLAKRPLDKPSGKFEPPQQKKVKPNPGKTSFRDLFIGNSKHSGKHRHNYGEDEEDDEIDSFIDDTEVDQHADQELNKMFRPYRNRIQKTRHLEDLSDDMEAGFEEIEEEENFSKFIGHKEDQEQLKYIQQEREEELRKEKKKKKLQID